ncbi:MAG: glycosyltransferase [Candidatus Omnitrophica bacterium]|nr:glycosyltransferase [Candidatus Omnitrophota bacterium]
MSVTLDSYEPIVGRQVLDEIRFLAEHLKGRRVLHVNSTAVGGGVAEILNRMVPLLNELGLKSRWEVIKGGEAFFQVTKRFHNALHGRAAEFSRQDFRLFLETNAQNARTLSLEAEALFIHDPQPAALVLEKPRQGGRWVWRCHVDVSDPQADLWRFLRRYIDRYDAAIFSAPQFAKPLPIRQLLIAPSIDPLAKKNEDLSEETIREVLHRLGVPRDKPLVTQISRFDALKDPLGVIEAFRLAKRTVDCRLILAGGGASDDPEGSQVLAEVREKAGKDPDILVLELPPGSDLEINALQRASAVIVQKSIREGFGLTVSEALWKGRPVVASAVGGIPLQIAHKYSGLLSRSIDGAALCIKQLLNNPAYAKRLGENGREHVRHNFLLTRHLKEYLLVLIALEHPEDVIPL